MDKADLLHAELTVSVLERHAAKNELAELGITASPADVSWWLSWPPKQRQKAAFDYAVLATEGIA